MDVIFADETEMQRAWKCARILGGLYYGNGDEYTGSNALWSEVAGVVCLISEEEYFTSVLGYGKFEYGQMKTGVASNHSKGSIPDFAHMQISLAARLAYKLGVDGMASDIGLIIYDEEISYLAGWLGDAVLPEDRGITTVIGNDDYCADLDAENIYRIILTNMSSVDAFNEYYYQIFAGANRAEIFLGYISYEYVQKKVFRELVGKELQSLAEEATNAGEYALSLYYINLMDNEEYYWNRIKILYSDTYDFLKSLRDGLTDMLHYE